MVPAITENKFRSASKCIYPDLGQPEVWKEACVLRKKLLGTNSDFSYSNFPPLPKMSLAIQQKRITKANIVFELTPDVYAGRMYLNKQI